MTAGEVPVSVPVIGRDAKVTQIWRAWLQTLRLVANHATVAHLTTTQRDALPSPTKGLVIYNTTTDELQLYTGSWKVVQVV